MTVDPSESIQDWLLVRPADDECVLCVSYLPHWVQTDTCWPWHRHDVLWWDFMTTRWVFQTERCFSLTVKGSDVTSALRRPAALHLLPLQLQLCIPSPHRVVNKPLNFIPDSVFFKHVCAWQIRWTILHFIPFMLPSIRRNRESRLYMHNVGDLTSSMLSLP